MFLPSILLWILLSIANASSKIHVLDALVGALPHVKTYDASWIVVLKDDLEESALEKTWSLFQEDGHQILHKMDFPRLKRRAFSFIPKLAHLKMNSSGSPIIGEHLWDAIVSSLSNDQQKFLQDSIAWVERNMEFRASTLQPNPVWNLDRIDQAPNPLDRRYGYLYMGSRVNVYVMDSGIRTTHEEFQGRAHFLYNAFDPGVDTQDCNGHGTHVAGIVGAKTYGVAKNVTLWNVKVLDCAGVGSSTTLLYGMNAISTSYETPAVLSLSLGGPQSSIIDQAATLLMRTYGVSIVVAAGNDASDACLVSPAHVDGVITVAASDQGDSRSSYSNYGSCVRIFAPGDDIRSLSASSDTGTVVYSGTSMAAPHASGVAALLLSQNRTLSVNDVYRLIVYNSTLNALSSIGPNSPNRLLFNLYNEGYDANNVATQSSFMSFLVDNWMAVFFVIVGLIILVVLYNFYKNRQAQRKAYETAYNYQLPFTSDYVNGKEVNLDYPEQTSAVVSTHGEYDASVSNSGNLQTAQGWTPPPGEDARPQAGYLRL